MKQYYPSNYPKVDLLTFEIIQFKNNVIFAVKIRVRLSYNLNLPPLPQKNIYNIFIRKLNIKLDIIGIRISLDVHYDVVVNYHRYRFVAMKYSIFTYL